MGQKGPTRPSWWSPAPKEPQGGWVWGERTTTLVFVLFFLWCVLFVLTVLKRE